jgi:hypothetical protein
VCLKSLRFKLEAFQLSPSSLSVAITPLPLFPRSPQLTGCLLAQPVPVETTLITTNSSHDVTLSNVVVSGILTPTNRAPARSTLSPVTHNSTSFG